MSSRNAYLSKLLFAQSLEPFDFTYRGMKYLLFTPKKVNAIMEVLQNNRT